MSNERTPLDDVPIFIEDELTKAVKSLKSRNAQGSDNIPAEALKAAVKNMFEADVRHVRVPETWRRQLRCRLISGQSHQRLLSHVVR